LGEIGNTPMPDEEQHMSSRSERMRDILRTTFNPVTLDIEDESAKHAGHAGRNGLPAGETHYRVKMISPAFTGMSRLARSRAVHAALDAEFRAGLHALSLSLDAPAENS
jgi:BolA protein